MAKVSKKSGLALLTTVYQELRITSEFVLKFLKPEVYTVCWKYKLVTARPHTEAFPAKIAQMDNMTTQARRTEALLLSSLE